MSLVERALRKLQESRDSAQGTQQTLGRAETGGKASRPPPSPRLERGAIDGIATSVEPRRRISFNKRALIEGGLLASEHEERRIADQYRQIKRPLVTTALRPEGEQLRNAHLIMVTSAVPGDGKTFTSVNLALSLSKERDFHALLIDADVAKPHITRFFGAEEESGLLDALRNPDIDIESLILPTDLPGLSILPAGQRAENATELLASQRMEELVCELGRRDARRIAVIDSPPLLLTNESRALAQWVGQIVVVVRAGRTLQQELMQSLSYLDQGKAIGLVLNQTMGTAQPYYYGYGEGQGSAARHGSAGAGST